jgi:adenylate kinase
MSKRVILITGTPSTGKTTIAKQLTTKLNAHYINLTDFANKHGLTLGEDKKRKTTIINEKAMQQKLTETINATDNTNIIIDGHYAATVTPPNLVTFIFVLRRNPKELKKLMQKNNYPEAKLNENLSAEILDTCLIEALQSQKGKVCELDVTGKSVQKTVNEILAVLNGKKKCHSGIVDWLGMLEKENILDDYLKI